MVFYNPLIFNKEYEKKIIEDIGLSNWYRSESFTTTEDLIEEVPKQYEPSISQQINNLKQRLKYCKSHLERVNIEKEISKLNRQKYLDKLNNKCYNNKKEK